MIQIYSCGTAPRHSERRTLFFDFHLFSLRLFCLLLFHSDMLFFFTELSQRRDLYDIFASARQGPFCPFTFSFFLEKRRFWLREDFASLFQTFSRNDLPGEAALARGRYVFQKKKRKKKGKKKGGGKKRSRERCKGVHCVDLGESFATIIYLQNLASIQPRTSLVKFARSPRTDHRNVRRDVNRCALLVVRPSWKTFSCVLFSI